MPYSSHLHWRGVLRALIDRIQARSPSLHKSKGCELAFSRRCARAGEVQVAGQPTMTCTWRSNARAFRFPVGSPRVEPAMKLFAGVTNAHQETSRERGTLCPREIWQSPPAGVAKDASRPASRSMATLTQSTGSWSPRGAHRLRRVLRRPVRVADDHAHTTDPLGPLRPLRA